MKGPGTFGPRTPWSRRRYAAMLVLSALLPVAARVALMPLHGVPDPANPDEFVHLLNSEMYARGRLAEPVHPMAGYLETVNVLQRPAYAGHYPPGQGLVLAAGRLLGHPWIGVLISGAMAGGASFWFCSAVFPLPWAMVGSIFCSLRWLTFSYWLHSYYGGPLTAFGALLLAGAAIRWVRLPQSRFSVIGAIGWSCLWLVRPFESLSAIPAVILAVFLLSRRAGATLRSSLRSLLPGVLVIVATGIFTCIHDSRVTGNPFHLPYHEAQKQHGFPQNPLFLPLVKDPGIAQRNIRAVYLWQLERREELTSWPAGLLHALRKPWLAGLFFFGPVMAFLLICVNERAWAGGRRLALWIGLVLLAPSLTYGFTMPHYSATLTPCAAYLITDALRRFSRAPFGISVRPGRWRLAVLVLTGMCSLMDLRWFRTRSHGPEDLAAYKQRTEIVERLEATPGNHLALVAYSPNHPHIQEWVYNSADIDASRIVWAQMPEERNAEPLLTYFRDRTAWVIDADAMPVRIRRMKADSGPGGIRSPNR